ncbi:MAG TPA: hypothetical protein VHG09_12060 [Longimicrobiales bacterium]|nr:hypothetical protein [Longimicrobiales bacterium]
MATPDVIYAWEELPEYRCTQQLGRCVGRILASLPAHYRRKLGRTLIRGSVLIAQGIAGANAEMPPGDDLTPEERQTFRSSCLASIEVCRDALRLLRSQRVGSLPDIMVALELLERIETGVEGRALPRQGRD